MTCTNASPAFLHSLRVNCAIPLNWIVTGFGPAAIKAFSAVSAGLLRIMSPPARCPT